MLDLCLLKTTKSKGVRTYVYHKPVKLQNWILHDTWYPCLTDNNDPQYRQNLYKVNPKLRATPPCEKMRIQRAWTPRRSATPRRRRRRHTRSRDAPNAPEGLTEGFPTARTRRTPRSGSRNTRVKAQRFRFSPPKPNQSVASRVTQRSPRPLRSRETHTGRRCR